VEDVVKISLTFQAIKINELECVISASKSRWLIKLAHIMSIRPQYFLLTLETMFKLEFDDKFCKIN
jgi:hypothetical protein